MLNKPNGIGNKVGINPVSRISPALAVENIGSVAQEMGDRALQFVKGQEYLAQVLSKVGDTAYNVKVEGGAFNDMVLKMELGSAVRSGQTLLLRYLQASPTPTFLLLPTPSKDAASTADISPTAQFIGLYLQKAEIEGTSTRFEATSIVTHAPNNSQVLAHDLKQAVSSSGLFYESHLSEMLQGNQSLTSIMQEPQNQAGLALTGLMSQQLAILENQRMSWHGEIWPGQKMDWDVYLQQKDTDNGQQSSFQRHTDEDRPIASELTLHLPHLGKVSARLSIIGGRMRIGISADQVQTLGTLKSQRQSLAQAIEKNGQQLDRLTISQYE